MSKYKVGDKFLIEDCFGKALGEVQDESD